MAPVTRKAAALARQGSATTTFASNISSLAETELFKVKFIEHKSVKRVVTKQELRMCIHTGASIETTVIEETTTKIYKTRTIPKKDLKC